MVEELQLILEKVRHLFLRYGIKSVTMDDIARELGISKKTLYQYVSDKTQLVEKIVELELESRECHLQEISDNRYNAIEELLEVNKYLVIMLKEFSPSAGYDLKKYYPELFARVNESRRKNMIDSVSKNIKKGKEEGIYRNDFDESIIIRLCVARFETFLTSELFSRDEITSPHFIKELFIYHIRGIANEKGIKLLEKKQEEIEIGNEHKN